MMTPISMQEVRQRTAEFLSRHWPVAAWGSAPDWSEPWKFKGSLPQGERQGVYALLDREDQLLYLGVGASFGRGQYEGYGLASRTNNYTRVAPGQLSVVPTERCYVPAAPWNARGLAAICTLGFEPSHAYLAYALEAFLLSERLPPFNKIHSARVRNA